MHRMFFKRCRANGRVRQTAALVGIVPINILVFRVGSKKGTIDYVLIDK